MKQHHLYLQGQTAFKSPQEFIALGVQRFRYAGIDFISPVNIHIQHYTHLLQFQPFYKD